GPTSNTEAALLLAQAAFIHDPMKVKYQHPIYASVEHPELASPYGRHPSIPRSMEIIDYRPEFMNLEEQVYQTSRRIKALKAFHFLIRPAFSEGQISREV